jgi:rubrerythrin
MLDKVYYNGELIKPLSDKPSKQRQWWLLNNHPCFTGKCTRCGYQFPRFSDNWNCPECGCEHD